MTSCIALIRHGATEWNAAGRIQGHTDTELSTLGRNTVSHWRVPAELRDWSWYTSPLKRARQTAQLLGCAEPTTTAALQEMQWGAWEGRLLTDLREQLGADFTENESRGLDFCPPGGESPRAVRERFATWMAALEDECVIGVTHKGVIRAALSLATHWDMRAAPPEKLQWNCAHLFHLGADGGFRIKRLNMPLSIARDTDSVT